MERKIKRKNTTTISLTINKEINEKIEELATNKSKLTEWLFIRHLEKTGVDVKNINF